MFEIRAETRTENYKNKFAEWNTTSDELLSVRCLRQWRILYLIFILIDSNDPNAYNEWRRCD